MLVHRFDVPWATTITSFGEDEQSAATFRSHSWNTWSSFDVSLPPKWQGLHWRLRPELLCTIHGTWLASRGSELFELESVSQLSNNNQKKLYLPNRAFPLIRILSKTELDLKQVVFQSFFHSYCSSTLTLTPFNWHSPIISPPLYWFVLSIHWSLTNLAVPNRVLTVALSAYCTGSSGISLILSSASIVCVSFGVSTFSSVSSLFFPHPKKAILQRVNIKMEIEYRYTHKLISCGLQWPTLRSEDEPPDPSGLFDN